MQKKHLILVLLLLSILFFILGLIFPILSTKQQVLGIVLKYQEVRLFDSISMFYKSGDYLLSGIIFLFTIIFPLVKLFDLINKVLIILKFSKKASYVLQILDKWSMLDVFLVALLLLNFKMDSNIIVMKLKIGTSFIVLSIIIRMFTTILINHKYKEI